MNPPKLTILAADTDAACDPETGTCTVPSSPCTPPSATANARTAAARPGAPPALTASTAPPP